MHPWKEPLVEDGSRTLVTETNSFTRITAFDASTLKATSQFAYKLEPLAYAPFPSGAFALNGVTEILYIGNKKLLVVERSYSTGRLACTIKVFLADLTNAENIIGTPSLTEHPPQSPVLKKLILNMDELIFTDNIEGVTLPNLPTAIKRDLCCR